MFEKCDGTMERSLMRCKHTHDDHQSDWKVQNENINCHQIIDNHKLLSISFSHLEIDIQNSIQNRSTSTAYKRIHALIGFCQWVKTTNSFHNKI